MFATCDALKLSIIFGKGYSLAYESGSTNLKSHCEKNDSRRCFPKLKVDLFTTSLKSWTPFLRLKVPHPSHAHMHTRCRGSYQREYLESVRRREVILVIPQSRTHVKCRSIRKQSTVWRLYSHTINASALTSITTGWH